MKIGGTHAKQTKTLANGKEDCSAELVVVKLNCYSIQLTQR